jgi:hypothetical protein
LIDERLKVFLAEGRPDRRPASNQVARIVRQNLLAAGRGNGGQVDLRRNDSGQQQHAVAHQRLLAALRCPS